MTSISLGDLAVAAIQPQTQDSIPPPPQPPPPDQNQNQSDPKTQPELDPKNPTEPENKPEESKPETKSRRESKIQIPPKIQPPSKPGVVLPPAKTCARYALPRSRHEYDVFLMVRRKKTTIFIDAKEDTSILELKRMISGITKVAPEDQKVFRDTNELKDEKHISDYGLNAGTAKPQLPATIGLVFKNENGEWEDLEIAPLSQPPELPEVMRQQEQANSEAA